MAGCSNTVRTPWVGPPSNSSSGGSIVVRYRNNVNNICVIGAGLGSAIAVAMHNRGIDLGSAAENAPDTLPINSVLHPEWEPQMALIAAGLAVVMALLGSLLPAIRALRIQPVTAMRSRR